MDECRLHRINRDLLQILDGEAIFLYSYSHLLGKVCVAHKPVV